MRWELKRTLPNTPVRLEQTIFLLSRATRVNTLESINLGLKRANNNKNHKDRNYQNGEHNNTQPRLLVNRIKVLIHFMIMVFRVPNHRFHDQFPPDFIPSFFNLILIIIFLKINLRLKKRNKSLISLSQVIAETNLIKLAFILINFFLRG